jgi:hypothetical protein
MFLKITAKLGNMKKAQEFVVCPVSNTAPHEVTIQSDKRIARVNLNTGKAMLSSGKGGHQGFMQLSPALGAVEVDVTPELIEQLKPLQAKLRGAMNPDGSITLKM